jgi:hypothetical protein
LVAMVIYSLYMRKNNRFYCDIDGQSFPVRRKLAATATATLPSNE